MVEAVRVPHLQVRVHFNILSFLAIIHLSPKVLHARDGPAIRRHLHNGKEEVALLFSLEWRPHSNHYFEIILI